MFEKKTTTCVNLSKLTKQFYTQTQSSYWVTKYTSQYTKAQDLNGLPNSALAQIFKRNFNTTQFDNCLPKTICLITKTRHTTRNPKICQEANNDKPQSLYGLTEIRTTRLIIMWWSRQQVNRVPPGWPQWKAHVSWWQVPADLEDKAQTDCQVLFTGENNWATETLDTWPCCFTSTEARLLIRDGDGGERGRECDLRLDRGYRPKKTGETVDRRQNNASVLGRCHLTIAQRLVHCTTAISTALLGRVTRTNPKRKKSNFRSPAPPPCSWSPLG